MIEYFGDHPGREHRGVQALQVLIGLAHNRQTITYERMSELLDFCNARTVKYALDPIFRYCKRNDLPPLTALVVHKSNGVPGDAVVEEYPDTPKVQAQVYAR